MQDLISFIKKYQGKCPKCKHKLNVGIYDIPQGIATVVIEDIEDLPYLIVKYKSSSYSTDEISFKVNLENYDLDVPNGEKYAATMKLFSFVRISLFCYDCHFESINKGTAGFNIIYDFKIKTLTSVKMNLNFYSFCFVRNDVTYVVHGDCNKNYQTVFKKKSNEGLSFTASSGFIPLEVWNFDDLSALSKKFDTIFLLM